MRSVRALLLALALMTVAAGTGAGAPQDDAGSGRDAPDAPTPDVWIASGEAYTGSLTDNDREDWFAFSGAAGDRVEVRVAGGYGCWEIGMDRDHRAGHLCATTPYAEVEVLRVVLDASGTWYLGYFNVPADGYRFAIGINEPAPNPVPGVPAVEPGPGSEPMAQDDAGSGRDAPNDAVDSIRIQSGTVYRGFLGGFVSDDGDDWYAFQGSAGDAVEASLRGSIACYEITDAGASRIDFGCTTPGLDEFGDSFSVRLTSTGLHFLHVYYFVPQWYSFAIGINEAAPQPDRVPGVGNAGPDPDELLSQDDAGSGRDAPNDPVDEVRIGSGRVYHGLLETVQDREDWYAFHGQAGDQVEVRLRGTGGACYDLTRSDGTTIDFGCTLVGLDELRDGFTATLPTSGLHFIYVLGAATQAYSFSIGINEPAPQPDRVPGAGHLVPQASAWRDAARLGEPLTVRAGEEDLTLSLTVNHELFAPSARVQDAAGSAVDHSDVLALRGGITGVPGSWVRATVIGDVVSGHIHHPDLGLLTLAVHDSGDTLLLTDQEKPPVLPESMLLAEPLQAPIGPVGGCLQAAPYRLAHPLGLATGWNERTYDLAFAVDDDFVDAYGTGWVGRAITYANSLDGFYTHSIDLRIRVADLHAHDHTHFTAGDTSGLLRQLSSHYGSAHAAIEREGAHLFVGKDLGTVVGQANCIGGAGDRDVAYTVGEALQNDASRYFGLDWFPDIALKIAAHELGHILSAHHHYANCGTERMATYAPQKGVSDVCTLMINDVGLAGMHLSTMNRLTTRGWSEAAGL